MSKLVYLNQSVNSHLRNNKCETQDISHKSVCICIYNGSEFLRITSVYLYINNTICFIHGSLTYVSTRHILTHQKKNQLYVKITGDPQTLMNNTTHMKLVSWGLQMFLAAYFFQKH